MSRVLFLCSGNTCRSPMAAGIAQRVFGPSHTIMSAGAETGSGGPLAPNAVLAASELGIDISNHSTVDMTDLDLASFDLLVVFRPSSAEYVALPQGVPVAYLDVADPYGSSLETYSAAARKIERGIRRLYVEDALRRASSGNVQLSSHLSGIFNRAAKECEKEVARFVATELQRPAAPKATMGQFAELIAAVSIGRPGLAKLSATVARANDVWVNVKHRNDPSVEDLVEGLTAVERVLELLEQIA